MNQILDHSGPKKPKIIRNYQDTVKIIRVYAILIIIFGISFIGQGAYSLSIDSKSQKQVENTVVSDVPKISLFADQDLISINIESSVEIESVKYQWYRGMVTSDEINEYEENLASNSELDETEDEDDDEMQEEVEEMETLGDLTDITAELDKKIAIPKGDTTIRVIVVTKNNNKKTTTEFIQQYHTDVGIDKIAPKVNVQFQGTKVIVVATDETEISKIVYSTDGGVNTAEFSEKYDKKTIKTEIELDKVDSNDLIISVVDAAGNTGGYSQPVELYVGKPEISFSAEPDFSKIYVYASYSKGIAKVEYEFNGESYSETFDNPADYTEIEITLDSQEGYNTVTVRVYAEEESVYSEDTGECNYNP